MKAWCISCRSKQEILTPNDVIHNGRAAISGTYVECGLDIIVYPKGEIE